VTYIREWALFAIRNLCDGNEDNQAIIQNLRMGGVQTPPELKDMGLKVEMDDGKLRIKKVEM
jgi:ataxin-10